MSDDSVKKRGRTLPLQDPKYAWWSDLIDKALAARALKPVDLARHYGIDEGRISRCLNRKVANIDLVIAISDYLGVPSPVFLAATQREADELARQRRLILTDQERRQLTLDAEANIKRDLTGKRKHKHRRGG